MDVGLMLTQHYGRSTRRQCERLYRLCTETALAEYLSSPVKTVGKLMKTSSSVQDDLLLVTG